MNFLVFLFKTSGGLSKTSFFIPPKYERMFGEALPWNFHKNKMIWFDGWKKTETEKALTGYILLNG